MSLPEIVNSLKLTVHSKEKTINHEPLTMNRKLSPAFTLIELLVACHPKLQRRKIIPGFTLIELLVVISIIAILMAVATVSYANAQQKGRDNKRKSDLKAIQQSLELYFQQNGKYPVSSATGQIQCNLTGDSNTRGWGTEFFCDPTGTPDPPKVTYMNPLPKEPTFTAASDIYYYNSAGASTYIISAKIENLNDKDIAPFTLPCTPQTGRNYCVINP